MKPSINNTTAIIIFKAYTKLLKAVISIYENRHAITGYKLKYEIKRDAKMHFSIHGNRPDGLNGVNRLAGNGENMLLITDKTRKKITAIYRQPTN